MRALMKYKMLDWPVGLSTGCFYRTSIFDCLERIREDFFGYEIEFETNLMRQDAIILNLQRAYLHGFWFLPPAFQPFRSVDSLGVVFSTPRLKGQLPTCSFAFLRKSYRPLNWRDLTNRKPKELPR